MKNNLRLFCNKPINQSRVIHHFCKSPRQCETAAAKAQYQSPATWSWWLLLGETFYVIMPHKIQQPVFDRDFPSNNVPLNEGMPMSWFKKNISIYIMSIGIIRMFQNKVFGLNSENTCSYCFSLFASFILFY